MWMPIINSSVTNKVMWQIGEFMAKIGKLCYGNPNRQAFCDGFVLPGTSGPWHCYCCQTLQAKLQGAEFGDKEPLNYSRIKCVVIGDQFNRKWQWPAVKIVYFPSKVYRG